MVRPGTLGNIKVGYWEYEKGPSFKKNGICVHPIRADPICPSLKPAGRLAKGQDVAARVVDLRVLHGVLLAAGHLDHLAQTADLLAPPRVEGREADARGVHDGVVHAAVGDVDRHLPQLGHLHLDVHVAGPQEGRRVHHLDVHGAPALAPRPDADEAGGRLEGELGHGLPHGHHPRLQQRSGHLSGVLRSDTFIIIIRNPENLHRIVEKTVN